MFEITIKAISPEELFDAMHKLASQFSGTDAPRLIANERSYQGDDAAREQLQKKRKAAAPKAVEPKPEDIFVPDAADDPTPEPMPAGAAVVVDAGTGKPVEQALNTPVEEPVTQMTFDDVKAAAAKLAAKNTPALAAILKKYEAAKLSEVPKDQLGDFAAEVLEALG